MNKPLNSRKPDALLTIAEVAALDNCSEKTVRRAIAAGLLHALRIGPGGRAMRVTQDAHLMYRLRLREGK